MSTSSTSQSSPCLEILRVTHQPQEEWGMGIEFDMPKAGERMGSHHLLLVGELRYTGRAPAKLLVYFDFFLMHVYEIHVPPSERGAEEGGRCTFRMGISTLGLPENARLDVRVDEAPSATLATIDMRRTRKTQRTHSKLQPCLLTGLGRSGTTKLMQLISAHPQIRANREYPLETRMAQYFMQRYYVSVSPAVHQPDYNIDNFFNRNWESMCGPCPYYHNPYSEGAFTESWYESNIVPVAEKELVESIEGYYQALGPEFKFRKSKRAHYFLEKYHPNFMPFLFGEFYPQGKEVFLVRDFRDMFASMLGFNEKRNSQDFGRKDSSSELDFLMRLRKSITQLSTSWTLRKRDALLVKYEELCRNESEVLSGIFDYLELPEISVFPATADEDLLAHQTSESSEASIGKWKQVLPKELAEACNREYAEALELFGYEVSRDFM
ncbi:sulfotransferase [Kiritimatiellota bacterium B12222]|nr:sulfotransferase [Kiritimatiellota bacterium B12222]